MTEKELFRFLQKNTLLTDSEIERDLKAGATYYPDNEEGYKEFHDNCVAGLCDEEDIQDMWNRCLEVIKDLDTKESYRFDWVL